MSNYNGQISIDYFSHCLGCCGNDRRYLKGMCDGMRDGKSDYLKVDYFNDCFENYGPGRSMSYFWWCRSNLNSVLYSS